MAKLNFLSRRTRYWITLGWLCSALAAHDVAAQTAGVPSLSPSTMNIGPARPFSQLDPQPVTHQVSKPMERLEMIVNTSRILTLEQRIPQAQVNNPEIVGLTALSPNQLQIFARRPGVTQVNIWDENQQIHSLDVMIYGDVQELARLLQTHFPKAALKLTPISTGVLIQGYVDDPSVQSRIVEIAQNYYPNVINAITVGGVQQVLLQVRVMEVSRTKLQSLGIDMAAILENGSFFASGAAGILTPGALTAAGTAATSGREVFTGRIANNGDSFFMFVEALKTNNIAKIVADPNLVTVSGRPAFMNSGGEIPIAVPQSLGTISIEYRRYGTQIDFVPIVLGNGVIRLEMYPRVSELDDSRSITINGSAVPAMRVREANTAAELRAGQTLAIAGLVQTRNETSTRGVPWLMDTPVIGSFFRRTSDQINEVELLILVTPQIVEGLDPQDLCQLPPMPGAVTTNPGDCQLFTQGHIEVRPDNCRPPHFQQPYPIGANGGAAGASALEGPGPAEQRFENVPSLPLPTPPVPTRAPINTPTPQPPAPMGMQISPAPGQSPTLEAKIRVASPPAIMERAAPGESVSTIPSSPSLPSLPSLNNERSTSSAGPGLIGPIGYEPTR